MNLEAFLNALHEDNFSLTRKVIFGTILIVCTNQHMPNLLYPMRSHVSSHCVEVVSKLQHDFRRHRELFQGFEPSSNLRSYQMRSQYLSLLQVVRFNSVTKTTNLTNHWQGTIAHRHHLRETTWFEG